MSLQTAIYLQATIIFLLGVIFGYLYAWSIIQKEAKEAKKVADKINKIITKQLWNKKN